MYDNDLLNLYGVKVVEYLLAIAYLVLFVGYWRWVQGTPRAPPPTGAPHQDAT